MGKTPKKAAPGGDERNLYDRRLKATTAPSKASETSLHERQRESESSNRPKLSGIQKRIPPGQGKTLKSKVHAPAKSGLAHQRKRVNKPPGTSKEGKTLRSSSVEPNATDMQPESEEAEVKLNVSVQKETTKEMASDSIKETVQENTDSATVEQVLVSEEQVLKTSENKEPAEEQIEVHESENDSQQNTSSQSKDSEEHEENDLKLSFETEDSPAKLQEEQSNDKDLKNENKEESNSIQVEMKNGIHEKEDLQSESQTDTESYSVDIVESTTSELSEVSEAVSQTDSQKEKEKLTAGATTDASFVSYDPSIMLKDVQIKLNDCLKDNSKLFDESNAEPGTPSQATRDMSFGKTLRNISGRHSINRMRHVTLREHRYSPNSSLFVNTSSMSLPQDETTDCKILRYSAGLSDPLSATNGTPMERKRKLDSDAWNSAKKQKTESENSLLNASISLLKGLRRPVQVSTPVAEYKFPSGKLNISGINVDESKIVNEPMEGTKKWCVIM